MIPHTISLTNFMCYRQAQVDFAGIHVACLAGVNGAGKSALLDGLTWAVWGKARARRDDELIRLGEDEMAVEFTFTMGGQTYRIIRRRKVGRRGSPLLDFQVRDGNRWRSIAESGIRATQAKIERVLHLDYNTFINSAFLRQGRADEFTVKTATERKRVLSDILGLDRWQVYEERAKERLKAIGDEERAIALRLQEIEAELSQQPQYEAQLRQAQQEVDGLAARLTEAEAAYRRVETARAELRHVEGQVAAQRERVARLRQDLSALAAERETHTRHRDEYAALLSQAEEIETGYRKYLADREEEQAWRAKMHQDNALNERIRDIQAAINDEKRRLEMERRAIERRIADLEKRLTKDASLPEQLAQVREQIAHLNALAEERQAAADEITRLAEEQAALKTTNGAIGAELADLQEKIARLEQAGAECPLCQRPLSDAHRAELLQRLRAEVSAGEETRRANRKRLKQLSAESGRLRERIRAIDKDLRRLDGLRRKEAALEERIAQGQQAAEQLTGERESLAQVRRRLDEEDYAHQQRAELVTARQQKETIGYDRDAHRALQESLARGERFAEQHARLTVAGEELAKIEETLRRLDEQEARLREQLAAEQGRQADWEQQAARLRDELRTADRVEAELNRIRRQEAAARQRLGAAQQRLEACRALTLQRDEKRRRQEELALERGLYEELREAFGVRGVPAMIIEAAVPEIESEANRLLSRMTNGRMHVRFDTQRETQAGAVRETLEIKIADEVGTRPYENYSGGEQFRVNFAIRIALSKLLARRAGAQLQTLVIDEGFGTQDAEGRERLVEAINAIQDDFTRVLVITHIEELMDAFPTRIAVTKTAAGSTVQIL